MNAVVGVFSSSLAGWLWLRACEKTARSRSDRGRAMLRVTASQAPSKNRGCVASPSIRFRFLRGNGCDLPVFCGRRHDARGAGRRVALEFGPGRGDGSVCFALSRPEETKMRTRLRDAVFWGGERESSGGHHQLCARAMHPAKWAVAGGVATEATPRFVYSRAAECGCWRLDHLHGWLPAIGPAWTHDEAAIGRDDAIDQRRSS